MGLDISGVFQKRDGDRYLDVSNNFAEGRDYELYRWLGLERGPREFDPIAPLRGFPDDFEIVEDHFHPTSANLQQPFGVVSGSLVMMGESGQSWLSASEILDTPPADDRAHGSRPDRDLPAMGPRVRLSAVAVDDRQLG